MTCEGLGEMFEGDSADMCAEKISASVDGGPSGGSHVRRPGSEDPQFPNFVIDWNHNIFVS